MPSAAKMLLYQDYYRMYSFVIFRGETVLSVELYEKMFQTKYVVETSKKCESIETATVSIKLIITVL